ncbi:hypothetical protein [Pseudomonas sp. ICMP 460]|uniref:hypothetical protein n=1 Tax=Pseudomonas sp. ICMP 460 TaxID=1718917 RepID=UPI000C08B4CD|nr:hypothetical protein [Pseudomonas sp. ICMP 460]PHN30218.1 hypothetical protein AO240_10105 [Pseudomonas sp. ICMP 460]
MNPNRYEIWDVNSATGKLIAQGLTVSTLHLAHGILRMQFNREVAYYAKRIADDVATGHMTPDQGIQAILQEQRELLSQAHSLARKGQDAITSSVKRIPLIRLTQPLLKPDPERLLRFAHAQYLRDSSTTQNATHADYPSPSSEDLKFFPRERWPEPIQLHEPGFYIVLKSTTADELKAQLFASPDPAVIANFKALNPNLDQVKAGQMIVLSDPNNYSCTYEETLLMEAAANVNKALQDLSPDEADFLARHRDEFESFFKYGSTAAGVGVAIFASNLEKVQASLRDIEALHQRAFLRDGHLRSPEFFAERKRLFGQLDSNLTWLTKKGIGFPDHPNLKSALGISSRSLVHRWSKAGAPTQIPGYATHMDRVAKAAKYVSYGGWLGTAAGGGASYMKVQEVCASGNTEACKKVKYTESGAFVGGIAGGAIGGATLGIGTTGAICVALGAPTAGIGALVCGLVVIGVGSFAAGAVIGKTGENLGEVIYEVTK